MSNITGITRGGNVWEPQFVVELNARTCIGCGRCYKVCPRDVFELVERAELGLEDADMDDEDFDDDDNMMVMVIQNPMDCIGCQSCAKVCPKKCHTHQAQPPVAA